MEMLRVSASSRLPPSPAPARNLSMVGVALEVALRVDGVGAGAELEVELGRAQAAGGADGRDLLAALHPVADLDQEDLGVGVGGGEVAGVADQQHVAVARQLVVGVDDD